MFSRFLRFPRSGRPYLRFHGSVKTTMVAGGSPRNLWSIRACSYIHVSNRVCAHTSIAVHGRNIVPKTAMCSSLYITLLLLIHRVVLEMREDLSGKAFTLEMVPPTKMIPPSSRSSNDACIHRWYVLLPLVMTSETSACDVRKRAEYPIDGRNLWRSSHVPKPDIFVKSVKAGVRKLSLSVPVYVSKRAILYITKFKAQRTSTGSNLPIFSKKA